MSKDMNELKVKNNSITEGPILKAIFNLAFPVVLGMFLEFALSTTDYFWVGKLGATAINWRIKCFNNLAEFGGHTG